MAIEDPQASNLTMTDIDEASTRFETPTTDVSDQTTIGESTRPYISARKRGQSLRKLPKSILEHTEIPSKVYAEVFDGLQLKQTSWDRFFDHVVYIVRQKNLSKVQTGSDISVRTLSSTLLRGFAYKIWYARNHIRCVSGSHLHFDRSTSVSQGTSADVVNV